MPVPAGHLTTGEELAPAGERGSHESVLLPAAGATGATQRVLRTPRGRVARHAAGPGRERMAPLLDLRPSRRPARGLPGGRGPGPGPGRDGRYRSQRAVAGG